MQECKLLREIFEGRSYYIQSPPEVQTHADKEMFHDTQVKKFMLECPFSWCTWCFRTIRQCKRCIHISGWMSTRGERYSACEDALRGNSRGILAQVYVLIQKLVDLVLGGKR